MDPRVQAEKSTPSKDIHNYLREKIAQSSYCRDSPFRWLPNVSTPPSRFLKISNPFEMHLTEQLHTSVFSPSVFNKETSPDDKFKWTIEEISNLKPADIDESSINQFSTESDPVHEKTVQQKIETFFSKQAIVPSPFDNAIKSQPLLSDDCSIHLSEESLNVVDESCQTILSLPPILPAAIEAALKPYFSYTVNQQSRKKSNDSLYKQLFQNEEDEAQPSPSESVQSSPAPSCPLSPIQFSPYQKSVIREQFHNKYGSLEHLSPLRTCDLSPIISSPKNNIIVSGQSRNDSSTRTRQRCNNDACHMSIDSSMNVVPDSEKDYDEQLDVNQSLNYESAHSFSNDDVLLNDSTINWSMEYKHVSLVSIDRSLQNDDFEAMDVSNANTPKSRRFSSQRKNLSNSFDLIGDNSEENKENIFNDDQVLSAKSQCRTSSKIALFNKDLTDAGYSTGLCTISDDGLSWNGTTLFASTPSKNKDEDSSDIKNLI